MGCFQQKEIDNAKFPKLTNRVHYLKHEEGAGKEIGQRQANITAIKNMIIRFHATKEVILEDYTESEYNTAIAELQAKAK